MAIKATSKQAKKWTSVDVDQAAQRQQLDRVDIIRKLQNWSELGVMELKTSGVINIYRVLQKLPSTPSEVEHLVDALYKELQARETQELDRMGEVIDLLTGSSCFAGSLAQHFGDNLPDQKTECGHCTWCETHQPVRLITAPPVPWDKERFSKVLKAVDARDDARFLARVAFGISSPRVTSMKLSSDPVFGSMTDHEFTVSVKDHPNLSSADIPENRNSTMHSLPAVRQQIRTAGPSNQVKRVLRSPRPGTTRIPMRPDILLLVAGGAEVEAEAGTIIDRS